MKKIMNYWIRKAVKILTFSICSILVVSLLIGGAAVYNIPYQGLDMPIRIDPPVQIDWDQLTKEESKIFKNKNNILMNKKNMIFKAALGYLGEAGQVGRGPPKYEIFSLLRMFNLRDLEQSHIKELIMKT